jgi:uncharacterized surface protein with fasciclin (FAS1) repeats
MQGDESQKKSAMSGLAVGLLVVGLIIGLVIGYPIGHSKGKKVSSSSASTSSMSMTHSSSNAAGVMVGGALMVPSKNIVANALDAKNVTTTVALVKDANLVTTLESAGPFTVFAPNNDAYTKLPAATVKSLQEPANVAALTKILTYHVVPGTYTSAALKVMATKGETLTTDAMGNLVSIQTSDVISSNGVTFVINSVLMP